MPSQVDFIKAAATELGLTEEQLRDRMKASKETFAKWLLDPSSEAFAEMPSMAWQLIREILENHRLKNRS